MAKAFQGNAFQFDAFQIGDVTGTSDTDLSDIIHILAKGKRGKHYYRTGPIPNHDTDYREWVETNPGSSRNPSRRNRT